MSFSKLFWRPLVWLAGLMFIFCCSWQSLWADSAPKTNFAPIMAGREHPQAGGTSVTLMSLAPSRLEQIDVQHYRLEIEIFPESEDMSGSNSITIKSLVDNLTELQIDLSNHLKIYGVTVDGVSATFLASESIVDITLPQPIARNDEFIVKIDYGGHPSLRGDTGLYFSTTEAGEPAIGNLSEPFGAPTWWPCVDDPADKASGEFFITVPKDLFAASNGLLQGEPEQKESTTTYHWKTEYPTATYLFSVAVAPFESFGDTYVTESGEEMPLNYYVYPENAQHSLEQYKVTKDFLGFYAARFGEYPFLKEKYGMADFPWYQGAMEHQTLTSMGGVFHSAGNDYWLLVAISHELSHQWWGDLVTIKSWDHLWLNEGFATYSEVLSLSWLYEKTLGDIMTVYDDGNLEGTVIANPADPFADSSAIYNKGAWVLHMLNDLLGPEKFLSCLREYATRFAFKNVETKDFQGVAEEFYGQSLQFFFDQWVYTPSRPDYSVWASYRPSPSDSGWQLTVTIRQDQSQAIVGRSDKTYVMPMVIMVDDERDGRQRFPVWNDQRQQEFVFTMAEKPSNITIDPDGWILKQVSYLGLWQEQDEPSGGSQESTDESVAQSTAATAEPSGESGLESQYSATSPDHSAVSGESSDSAGCGCRLNPARSGLAPSHLSGALLASLVMFGLVRRLRPARPAKNSAS